MNSNTRLFFISGIIISFFFVLWVGPYFGQTSYREIDPDSVYHQIRIDNCLKHFPLVKTWDVKSHYPTGNTIHWPNGYTALMATCQTFLGAKSLSWIPVSGGLLCLWLILGFLHRKFPDQYMVLPLTLIFMMSLEANMNFLYGTIDHHWAMQLAFLLMGLTLLGSPRILAAGGVALAFLSSPESIIFVSIYSVLQTFRDIVLWKETASWNKLKFFHFLPFLMASTNYLIHYGLEYRPDSFFSLELRTQSLFQPVWFLFMGLFALSSQSFFVFHLSKTRNVRSFFSSFFSTRHNLFLLTGLALLGLWACFFFKYTDGMLYLNRLTSVSRLPVAEERSIFFYPSFIRSGLHYKIYLLMLAGLLFAVTRGTVRRIDAFILSVIVLFGMKEFRYLRIISPIAALLWAYVLVSFSEWLRNKKITTGTRHFISLSLVLLCFLGLLPRILKRATRAPYSNPHRLILKEIKTWSQLRPPQKDTASIHGALAPWSYGHHIHYRTGLGVTVDPFNFPTPITRILSKIYPIQSTDEIESVFDRYDIDHLVLCWSQSDFFRAGVSLSAPLKQTTVFGYHTTVFSKELRSYPLLAANADFNQLNFELGFVTEYNSEELRPQPIEYGEGNYAIEIIPLVQVFRKHTTAHISGQLPASNIFLTIEYRIKRKGVPNEQCITHTVETASDGSFCIEVSHAAPAQYPGLQITTGYTLTVDGYFSYIKVPQEDSCIELTPVWEEE